MIFSSSFCQEQCRTIHFDFTKINGLYYVNTTFFIHTGSLYVSSTWINYGVQRKDSFYLVWKCVPKSFLLFRSENELTLSFWGKFFVWFGAGCMNNFLTMCCSHFRPNNREKDGKLLLFISNLLKTLWNNTGYVYFILINSNFLDRFIAYWNLENVMCYTAVDQSHSPRRAEPLDG